MPAFWQAHSRNATFGDTPFGSLGVGACLAPGPTSNNGPVKFMGLRRWGGLNWQGCQFEDINLHKSEEQRQNLSRS